MMPTVGVHAQRAPATVVLRHVHRCVARFPARLELGASSGSADGGSFGGVRRGALGWRGVLGCSSCAKPTHTHTRDTQTRATHTQTRDTHTAATSAVVRRRRSNECPERAAHGTKVLSCSVQPVRNAGQGPVAGMMRQDRAARQLGCSGVGWQRAQCAPDGLRRLGEDIAARTSRAFLSRPTPPLDGRSSILPRPCCSLSWREKMWLGRTCAFTHHAEKQHAYKWWSGQYACRHTRAFARSRMSGFEINVCIARTSRIQAHTRCACFKLEFGSMGASKNCARISTRHMRAGGEWRDARTRTQAVSR